MNLKSELPQNILATPWFKIWATQVFHGCSLPQKIMSLSWVTVGVQHCTCSGSTWLILHQGKVSSLWLLVQHWLSSDAESLIAISHFCEIEVGMTHLREKHQVGLKLFFQCCRWFLHCLSPSYCQNAIRFVYFYFCWLYFGVKYKKRHCLD